MPAATTGGRSGNPLLEGGATKPRRQGLAESLATGAALVVCMLARVPQHALDAAGIRAWAPALVVVVAVVSGVRVLVRTPFTMAQALATPASRPAAVRRSARTELHVLLVSIAVGTVTTIPLYALLRSTPFWWLWAAILFGTGTVVAQVTMPAFLRSRAGPLAPAPLPLVMRLEALAHQAGVDVSAGVLVTAERPGRPANAYVAGLGPSRRVVLEHPVAAWPPELVDQVVAHELGHWRLGHNARRLPVTILCQVATLALAAVALSSATVLGWGGVARLGDPASYPLLLVVGAVLALPARCLLAWRDRAQERAADRFALTLLGQADEFAAMLDRAAAESGAPRQLPWWKRLTASHPPIDERAAACRVDHTARLQPSGV